MLVETEERDLPPEGLDDGPVDREMDPFRADAIALAAGRVGVEAGVEPASRASQIAEGFTLRPALDAFQRWFGRDPSARSGRAKYTFDRRADFRLGDLEPGEHERYLSHWISALAHNPEARTIYELTVDRAAEADRRGVIEGLRNEERNFTPVLVIGAGVHGTVFTSELARLVTGDIRPLMVDKRSRIGSHFRGLGARFFMNNRLRPLGEYKTQRPGDSGSIFPMGRATVQVSDLSDAAHATDADTGMAIATNSLLNGIPIADLEFVETVKVGRPSRLPGLSKRPGDMRTTLRDTRSGELLVVHSNYVVHAEGLGKPSLSLPYFDGVSREILSRELRKQEETVGYKPKILTDEDFLDRMADPQIQFPLQGYNKIVIVGDGDGASAVIKAIFGLGPAHLDGAAELDSVDEVVQIGSLPNDRDQRRIEGRNFYSPETDEADRGKPYNGRLRVINSRVSDLFQRRTSSPVCVLLENGSNVDGDLIVFATGKVTAPLPDGLEPVEVINDFGKLETVAYRLGYKEFFIGPQTGLPAEPALLKRISELYIPQNAVAGFAFEPKTRSLARIIAQALNDPKLEERRIAQERKMIRLDTPDKVRLPHIRFDTVEEPPHMLEFVVPEVSLPLRPEFRPEPVLATGLNEVFGSSVFPTTMAGQTMEFTYWSGETNSDPTSSSSSLRMGLPASMVSRPEFSGIISGMSTHPFITDSVRKVLGNFGAVTVRVPIASNGGIDSGAIVITPQRNSAKTS